MTIVRGLVRVLRRKRWLRQHRGIFHDTDLQRPRRLLVDVSVIIKHDAQTGIQRVVRAVWLRLLQYQEAGKLDRGIVPIFASQIHGYCYASSDFLDRAGHPKELHPVGMGRGDIFLGLDLAAHILPRFAAQLRAWRAQGASLNLIVYDLLPLTHPQWFKPASHRNFRRWLGFLSQHADQALCISRTVAGELRKWLATSNVHAARGPAIGLIRLGGDIAASAPTRGITPSAQVLLDDAGRRSMVLMVGTVEPRKGHEVALRAFEHLWQARPQEAPILVVIGKPGWHTVDLQRRMRSHPEQGRRLFWFEDASDEALEAFYRACRAVLMLSAAEGYGLPVLEAATHRRPVVVRDLPIFREHDLPNVTYLESDEPAPVAEKIMAALSSPSAEAAATMKVTLPTWSDCVDDLLRGLGIEAKREVVSGAAQGGAA